MKATIFLAICIVTPALAFPQSFFPKAGLSFARIATSDVEPANDFNDDYMDVNFRTGYLVGFGFNIPLGKRLSIQPEFMYVQKGTQTDFVADNLAPDDTGIKKVEIHNNIKINYLESVLLVRYIVTSPESKVPVYVAAGASAGSGLGGKRKHFTRDEYYDSEPREYRREDEVRFSGRPWELLPSQIRMEKKADFGMCIGGGVTLWKKVIIDLRYTHSFTSMFTPSSYDLNGTHYEYDNSIRHQGIQLSIVLPIVLKKD